MNLPLEVIVRHKTWQHGYPAMVQLWDRARGQMLFEDTVAGIGDWLDTFDYKWAGESGVWYRREDNG